MTSTIPPPESRRRRGGLATKLLVSIAALVGLVLLLEGGLSFLLAWHDAGSFELHEVTHGEYDPLLGYVNKKGVQLPNLYGPHRDLTTNARGFRGSEEYTPEVPPDRYRIVCLGDSFTLGYGVDDSASYPAQLEARSPRCQVVNMGQGGYGVGQCYLWYGRDGVELDTDLLLLVFIAMDFDRMMHPRFALTYPKPVLKAVDGALVLPEEPVPDDWERGEAGGRLTRFTFRVSALDFLSRVGRRFGSEEAPVERIELPYRDVAELVIADLARLSRERGQDFALVHLPVQRHTYAIAHPEDAPPADDVLGRPTAMLAWLTSFSASLEVPFFDLTEDFDRLPEGEVNAYFLADSHYNSLGNRFVAEALLQRLRAQFPELP
jgi:hypothetical protein